MCEATRSKKAGRRVNQRVRACWKGAGSKSNVKPCVRALVPHSLAAGPASVYFSEWDLARKEFAKRRGSELQRTGFTGFSIDLDSDPRNKEVCENLPLRRQSARGDGELPESPHRRGCLRSRVPRALRREETLGSLPGEETAPPGVPPGASGAADPGGAGEGRSKAQPNTASACRGEDTQQECAICSMDFVCGDRTRSLPCKHVYHLDCIDEWLMRSCTCPYCRRPPEVPPPPTQGKN
ncbi:RING finger protein 11 [Camelus dromedarius]|uniref:RING finger protein 11 n=1 Tax=Camelus dromedarius TaxID=9838 RepID=A0A5N4EJH7_CAMDR|nr:RING finger protein 11 [Camelus dromedarius]